MKTEAAEVQAIPALFQCKISADLLRRAWPIRSTEMSRFYLRGVHVEADPNGGAIIVATDGRRIVMLRDPDGVVVNGPAIISLSPEMVKPKKADPANLGSVEYYIAKGDKAAMVRLHNRGVWQTIAPVDFPDKTVSSYQWKDALLGGTFPDWRRITRDADPKKPLGPFDQNLLTDLAKALRVEWRKSSNQIRLMATGDMTDPILVLADGVEGYGMIMPLRNEGKNSALPTWAKAA